MADPDWVARGIAVGSLLLSSGALHLARFDGRWRRRHAAIEPIRSTLEGLRGPINNPSDQIQVRPLFSVSTGADLALLESTAERIPDRQLRPRLKSLVSNLNAIRSMQQPGGQLSLDPAQTRKLIAAKSDLEWVLARADKAAKRGVV
jgi:hypothetical protein